MKFSTNRLKWPLKSLSVWIFLDKFCFQTIFDSGTYEELCQRQSITAESIYGDEFDADPTVSSDVDSPSEGQNSNPESDNSCAKDKRHQFLRQNSVLQYMRDQKSIDDDPVNILQKIVSICFIVFNYSNMNVFIVFSYVMYCISECKWKAYEAKNLVDFSGLSSDYFKHFMQWNSFWPIRWLTNG